MICLVAGTNRPSSQTLRVTRLYQRMFEKEGVATELLDLTKLPPELFLPEAYGQKPAGFAPFSDAILRANGLVIVTPEYNGGFPGVLKMFIDHLKFPESFEGRPVAFVGISAGMWGALRAVEQLQMVFAYRNACLFNQRVFLPRVETQISGEEELKDPLVRSLAEAQVKGFKDFCARLKGSA